MPGDISVLGDLRGTSRMLQSEPSREHQVDTLKVEKKVFIAGLQLSGKLAHIRQP